MIDWDSSKGEILLNPRDPQRAFLESKLHGVLDDHFWFLTSGSTGQTKAVALSKNALLTSAKAVNAHLQATNEDIWLSGLPHFHVGGAGILARAHLSGSSVITLPTKWDPALFLLEAKKATLTALVPTQVWDLVTRGYKAPPSLRAVIVGGGELSSDLYNQAQKLGWPLMPSYGLTECASQVATANLGSPKLPLLHHIDAKINDGRLSLKSPALLTTYALFDQGKMTLEDPKVDGWFTTEDCATLENNFVSIQGRSSDFVKIGGESVDLKKLSHLVDSIKGSFDCALIALPDERLGHILHLAHTKKEPLPPFLDRYHEKVLPFERIRKTHLIPAIPRSPLGKLMKGELIKLL